MPPTLRSPGQTALLRGFSTPSKSGPAYGLDEVDPTFDPPWLPIDPPPLNAVKPTAFTQTVSVGPQTQASGTGVTNDTEVHALRVDVARATYTVPHTGAAIDGTGLKIGILSDSFDLKGGAAGDSADGDLPSAANIHILQEGASGADEGRAMAQLIHRIAPGAQIYFYTAFGGESSFANGITTLANNGCTVIVDDVSYSSEPFYQDTGVITAAVESVIASGVSYFTSAGNASNNFYEAAFNPMSMALAGIGTRTVHNVGGGSANEQVTLQANARLDFDLQWTQPFATGPGKGTKYDIGVALYDQSGTLVQNFTTSDINGDPVLAVDTNLTNAAGTYNLVFYESAGTPTPGTFKILFNNDSGATINGVGSGVGSGTSVGHELVPKVNTVAAVNYNNTPAYGTATPVVEGFSSYGPGTTYFDKNGNLLATPVSHNGPTYAATDASPTSVFNPFYGTSASAPNAAAVGLLLQQTDSRLSNVQLTYVLQKSAVPTANALNGGAGLIQADVAVGSAFTAATTPEWQGVAGNGNGNWSTAADWTDNAVPTSTDAVLIGNGLGTLSGAYTVTFDPASSTVASLGIDGGTVSVVPDLKIAAGHALTVSGSVSIGSGLVELAGALTVGGSLAAAALAGLAVKVESGVLTVAGGEALAISFVGAGGSVILSATATATLTTLYTGGISNFSASETLDLSGLSYRGSLGVSYDSTNALIYDGAMSNVVAKVALSGGFTQLALQQDAGTGTQIVACYVRGTLIATPDGDVEVERLVEGGMVSTVAGGDRPIRWIGRRSYAGRFLVGRLALLPIRIHAGALADGVPARDLLVSPMHAMLLDEVLVPAGELVNGVSITREDQARRVEYFHIELDSHDVIWAEGAASETFVDDQSRGVFHNAAAWWRANPDAAPAPATFCTERVEAGHALEAIRRRLARRAGIIVDAAEEPELRGGVEHAGPDIVSGWALNAAYPGAAVCLDVLLDGVAYRQILANRPRLDLGQGLGFSLALPPGPAGRRVEVRLTVGQALLAA